MKKILLAIVVLALAAAAQASTVTLGLKTTSSNIWKLYAVVSNDCAGLASFDISFGGGAFGQITSSTVKAPKGYDPDLANMVGFKMFTGNGVVTTGAVNDITGGQSTAYGDVYDPDAAKCVLQGVGQAPGIRTALDDSLIVSWAQPVLLAQGTYSGSAPIFWGTAAGGVLNGVAGGWTGPGNVSAANFVMQLPSAGNFPFPAAMGGASPSEFIPEPATLALLATGGVALIRRRR
jgi:hypothetical protein